MNENDIDEFAGQGGSYIMGADGKRTLVERTKDPEPTAQAAPVDADAIIPPVKSKKGA